MGSSVSCAGLVVVSVLMAMTVETGADTALTPADIGRQAMTAARQR